MFGLWRALLRAGLLMLALDASAQEAKICPLPTKQNVSFSAVQKLATGTPDQLIAYGDDPLQFAELWLPGQISAAETARSLPVVVLVHGGCWLNEYDIAHTHALSSALRTAGYAVWSLEYRRTGDKGGGWPGSYNDIVAGLNALVLNTRTRLDLNKIALVGHSAGGHLALLVANEPNLELEPSIVIGLAPIVDVTAYSQGENSCQQAAEQFFSGPAHELAEQYRAATPQTEAFRVPVVALHGSLDQIVPLEQSAVLNRRLLDGAGHFDFIHPHTPAFQALLRALAQHL